MAKNKRRKENKKEVNSFAYELVGFLLILMSIVGFIEAGPIGRFVKSFAIFLVGTWYALLFIGIIVASIYMMFKRKKPDLLSGKLIGLYILVIGILTASHVKYLGNVDLKGTEIITETINNFMVSNGNASANICGGFLGATFSLLFLTLFELKGTKIVIWALIIIGFVLFTGISLVELLKNTASNVKESVPKRKERKEEKEESQKQNRIEVEEEKEETVKKVVSSYEELLKIADTKEEKEEVSISNYLEKEIEKEEFIDPSKYTLPPISLLAKPSKKISGEPKEVVTHNVETLERVLNDFGIVGHVVAINPGPAITQYELEVKSGTKMSKVSSLNKEIALALAAKDVRIEAPIPGKSTIGVEIPNTKSASVTVREILENVDEKYKNSKLLVSLGKDIKGKPCYCEINKTPHLLVAGSTGSGKSVCINSFIVSILMRAKPEEVKLVLVDPKKVEFSMYNGIPHLLTPVVTDPRKASTALKKIVVEMENRYDMFSNSGTKNIEGYNEYVRKENQKRGKDNQIKPLSYIVVIIDELADLMLVAAKDVEDSIMRITQMARAAGIHLIVATQRPSTDVITGVVKSNIPARISFAVSSSIDSRTILDLTGAEKLLGKGDMLYKPQDDNTPTRIQGTYISDEEINKVTDFVIRQQKARYDETFLMDSEEMGATTMVESNDATEEPLYNEMVEFVVSQQKASTSLLQRRFKIGYNRAARAIDLLEERGIIGPSNGAKPREVYIKVEE